MLYQVVSRLREQNLPAMPGAHDSGSVMDIQANVAFRGELWLAGMYPNARQHGHIPRPAMEAQGALNSYGCLSRIDGTSKDHKEGITLRVNFAAIPLLKRRANNAPVIGQQIGVTLTQLLQQASRPYHIHEEQCDGSSRQIIGFGLCCLLYHVRSYLICNRSPVYQASCSRAV